jgi:hypothetical protein
MITGTDTVMISPWPVREKVERFFLTRSQGWSSMLVQVSGGPRTPFSSWGREGRLPVEGEVLVARDERMCADWDEDGYALDASGEGPFAVYYQRAGREHLRVALLEDPYRREGFGFAPFEATLVGAMALVTLVTPDAESPFCRELRDGLESALRA